LRSLLQYVGGEALMSSIQRRHSHQQTGSVGRRVESIRGQRRLLCSNAIKRAAVVDRALALLMSTAPTRRPSRGRAPPQPLCFTMTCAGTSRSTIAMNRGNLG
ncbi:hypothetical protein KCU90_g248, partial [Aureobasidium melanogenum]